MLSTIDQNECIRKINGCLTVNSQRLFEQFSIFQLKRLIGLPVFKHLQNIRFSKTIGTFQDPNGFNLHNLRDVQRLILADCPPGTLDLSRLVGSSTRTLINTLVSAR